MAIRNDRRFLGQRGLLDVNRLYNTGPADRLAVPIDGPERVYTPASAADWMALGLPAPDYQWNCQDASGHLAAAIGAYPTAFTSGTRLYQQSVPGWTRNFIGTDATDGSWYLTDAATSPGASESYAMLSYLGFTIPDAQLYTTLSCIGGDTASNVLHNSSKRQMSTQNQAGFNANTGVDYGTDVNVIRPILWGRNCTATTSTTFTNLETFTQTYSAAAPSSATKPLFAFNSRARTMRVGLVAMWRGANAETILQKRTLQALYWQQLPY